MSNLALDVNGDLLDGSTLGVVTDNAQIAQRIQTCMSLLPGESCVFPDVGIDWLSRQFTRPSSLPAMRAVMRSKILAIDGVSSIQSFECDVDDSRGLVCSVVAVSDSGALVSGSFNGVT